MMFINNCRIKALEIVYLSEAPNDAWRNLESHYRPEGTREILRLSHEVNGKTMQLGEKPFKFMTKLDRLAADLHGLSDKSVTELTICVIILAGLPADYTTEVRRLENNPSGLERTEVEHVVGDQYNRLLRQYHESKTLSASGSTATADRGEKKRRPRNRFEGNCFHCGGKGHRAEDCRSAKKKMGNSRDIPADKKGGGWGKCYVCGSEKHFAHKHWLVQTPGAPDSRL